MTGASPDLLRDRMVEGQLRSRDIRDPRVLEALGRVPRHLFVPPEQADRAYGDHPVGIGFDQTMSQPYMVALMTQALETGPGLRVLEVGTGSGYQTAILLDLGLHVCTMERVAELSAFARGNLSRAGFHGAVLRVGDGTLGWPEGAPWDRIVVTAGSPSVPPRLLEQLGPGGILVIPVGPEDRQELLRFRRAGDGVVREKLCDCMFVKLLGRQGWPPP